MRKTLLCTIILPFACMVSCSKTVTPKQGLKKASTISIVENDGFGKYMKDGKHVDIMILPSTRYFDSDLKEIEKDDFDEKDTFYVYYVSWQSTYPITIDAIYMYES